MITSSRSDTGTCTGGQYDGDDDDDDDDYDGDDDDDDVETKCIKSLIFDDILPKIGQQKYGGCKPH